LSDIYPKLISITVGKKLLLGGYLKMLFGGITVRSPAGVVYPNGENLYLSV